ncbi:MAG: PEP-CTERM sorting domain-containing protein [Steroidobacteraceae bacterium]
MTKKNLIGLGLAVAIGVGAAGTALATPIELTVASGTSPGMSILLPGTGSLVSYSNASFEGWNISFAIGTSKSPSAALGGLDLSTETAACFAASCDPLTIAISDVGFMTPLGPNGLATGLADLDGGATSGIKQWAYMDTSNSYFARATLIGALAVDGSQEASAIGGSAASGPYSLTLVDQFCSDPPGSDGTCAGGLSFQSVGNITAPEPGGLALFGAGLLGFALFASRRRGSIARAV